MRNKNQKIFKGKEFGKNIREYAYGFGIEKS